MMKIYAQTDSQGFYIGTQADESVAGAIDTAVPCLNEGERARWNGEIWDIRTDSEWDLELNPSIPETEPVPLELRLAAYRAESDHLKTEAEYDALENGTGPDYTLWRAKVKEIKSRIPLDKN